MRQPGLQIYNVEKNYKQLVPTMRTGGEAVAGMEISGTMTMATTDGGGGRELGAGHLVRGRTLDGTHAVAAMCPEWKKPRW